MPMQRIAFLSLVTTSLLAGTALAGPLNLQPSSDAYAGAPRSGIGTIFAAPEQAPVRPAAAETNYGGGFLEMLFRPQGGQQRSYQPEPQGSYQPEPRAYQPAPRYYQTEPQAAPMPPPYQPQSNARSFDPQQDWLEPARPSSLPSRSAVSSRFDRQEVDYNGPQAPGTVIINTRERLLYHVHANGKATRYGIGVGRPGFTWAGNHTITNKREWPDWRPPAEMIKRQPHLPRYMPGGPDNPLGARAMYLGSTLYRIHGSNEPQTIGQAVSSGCIRMRNEDVIHLYERVRVGTRVVVI
jgi:lipoprotein-anchoring transpeptidase ErfK/SrfK